MTFKGKVNVADRCIVCKDGDKERLCHPQGERESGNRRALFWAWKRRFGNSYVFLSKQFKNGLLVGEEGGKGCRTFSFRVEVCRN